MNASDGHSQSGLIIALSAALATAIFSFIVQNLLRWRANYIQRRNFARIQYTELSSVIAVQHAFKGASEEVRKAAVGSGMPEEEAKVPLPDVVALIIEENVKKMSVDEFSQLPRLVAPLLEGMETDAKRFDLSINNVLKLPGKCIDAYSAFAQSARHNVVMCDLIRQALGDKSHEFWSATGIRSVIANFEDYFNYANELGAKLKKYGGISQKLADKLVEDNRNRIQRGVENIRYIENAINSARVIYERQNARAASSD